MGIIILWRYKIRHFNSLIINGDEASDRVMMDVCKPVGLLDAFVIMKIGYAKCTPYFLII